MRGLGGAAEVEEKCAQTCKSRFRRTEMAVSETTDEGVVGTPKKT